MVMKEQKGRQRDERRATLKSLLQRSSRLLAVGTKAKDSVPELRKPLKECDRLMDEVQDLAIEVAKAKDPAELDIEDRRKKLGRRLMALEEQFALLGVEVGRAKKQKPSEAKQSRPPTGEETPSGGHAALGEHPSDWVCAGCAVVNFGSRSRCIECFAAAPPAAAAKPTAPCAPPSEPPAAAAAAVPAPEAERPPKRPRAGDAAPWVCPACQRSNAAPLGACEGCNAPRPGLLKGDWVCEACQAVNFASRRTCVGCRGQRAGSEGGKAGDWTCTGCARLNFASRKDCFSCGLARQADAAVVQSAKKFETREGDWTCASCGGTNFSFRASCFKCKVERANAPPASKKGHKQHGGTSVKSRGPRWTCAACQAPNAFQHNTCHGCQGPRNGAGLKPGDWVCAKCDAVNFRSKDACEDCGAPVGWDCPCGEVNARHRSRCSACDTAKPGLVIPAGDWVCVGCTGVNYSGRFACYSCTKPRPEDTVDNRSKAMRDGWSCAACRRINFRWHEQCRRCGAAPAAPAGPRSEANGSAKAPAESGDGGAAAEAVDAENKKEKKEKKAKKRKQEAVLDS
eukprot:EG_transcript_7532